MNKIKRNFNNRLNVHLDYKFGFFIDHRINEKIIETSRKNKRIILNKDTLHLSLFGNFSEEIIKSLVSEDILDIEYFYNVPLEIALSMNYSFDIIKLLLPRENVGRKNTHGNTFLHIALFNKNSEDIITFFINYDYKYKRNYYYTRACVQKFIENGENILNEKNNKKNTPLHVALEKNYPAKIIKLLITDKNVNMTNDNENTPLHIALSKKYPIEIINLLKTKRNLDAKNKKGNTILHSAINSHYPLEFIKTLIKKYRFVLCERNIYKNTPLHSAILNKSCEETIRFLITEDNLNDQNSITQDTPLHSAIKNNYSEEIINLLLTDLNKYAKNRDWKDPRMLLHEKKYPQNIISNIYKCEKTD